MNSIGKTLWLVPDMFLPESVDTAPYIGHESVCILNTGDSDCDVECTVYFCDREPLEGLHIICPARRSVHARMNDLCDKRGIHIPLGVPYSAAFICSVPVVIQCTRVDTTQENLALMSAIAYGA